MCPLRIALFRCHRAAGLLALLGAAYHPGAAMGQCQIANPSFELLSDSGDVFAAWSQINAVQDATDFAAHGQRAVRLQGPNNGDWDISGVWQWLETTPGERWVGRVRAGHRTEDPVTGDAAGVIVVQWYDAGQALIAEEEYPAVLPSTPPDILHRVEFETGPAPAGPAVVLIIPAFLQSPANETGAVDFDHVQFRSQDTPTLEQIQWNDFPGGRMVDFAGRSWRVKGPGFYGPGPSCFADAAGQVWVDPAGRLHMTVRRLSGI